jgi:hypothetical protein
MSDGNPLELQMFRSDKFASRLAPGPAVQTRRDRSML